MAVSAAVTTVIMILEARLEIDHLPVQGRGGEVEPMNSGAECVGMRLAVGVGTVRSHLYV